MRSVRVDESTLQQLEAESRRTGDSVEQIVRTAIRETLRPHEGVALDVLLKDSIGVVSSKRHRAPRRKLKDTEAEFLRI